MCRLALMNREAVQHLGSSLDALFAHLEQALGGDGNGVAGLWVNRGSTKIRKGVKFTAAQTALYARTYVEQGADWILFHTRHATSSMIEDQHCHPYQSRHLLMAHNGHDAHFASLSKSLGISDSECITRIWSHMHFPLSILSTCSGVFMGFAEDHPFVVKGQKQSNLLAAWQRQSGAVLFASELPSCLPEGAFDQIVSIDTIQWFGRDLDPATLNIHPYVPHRAEPAHFRRSWDFYEWASGYGYLDDEIAAIEAKLHGDGKDREETLEKEDWRYQRQVEKE